MPGNKASARRVDGTLDGGAPLAAARPRDARPARKADPAAREEESYRRSNELLDRLTREAREMRWGYDLP